MYTINVGCTTNSTFNHKGGQRPNTPLSSSESSPFTLYVDHWNHLGFVNVWWRLFRKCLWARGLNYSCHPAQAGSIILYGKFKSIVTKTYRTSDRHMLYSTSLAQFTLYSPWKALPSKGSARTYSVDWWTAAGRSCGPGSTPRTGRRWAAPPGSRGCPRCAGRTPCTCTPSCWVRAIGSELLADTQSMFYTARCEFLISIGTFYTLQFWYQLVIGPLNGPILLDRPSTRAISHRIWDASFLQK